MARPKIITDESKVRVNARGQTKLQTKSARRAVVNFLIEEGGAASVAEINDRFDIDMTSTIQALLRIKWIELIDEVGA
jgi:hypothetical protein